MNNDVSAVQAWWTTATPRSRRWALALDPVEAVPAWLAEELTQAGVPLTMALFTEGRRITRRYVQSAALRTFLCAERASVSVA